MPINCDYTSCLPSRKMCTSSNTILGSNSNPELINVDPILVVIPKVDAVADEEGAVAGTTGAVADEEGAVAGTAGAIADYNSDSDRSDSDRSDAATVIADFEQDALSDASTVVSDRLADQDLSDF